MRFRIIQNPLRSSAQIASTPKHLAENLERIVVMLSDFSAVKKSCSASQGALKGASKGTVPVDMSHIAPWVALELAEYVRSGVCEAMSNSDVAHS